MCEVDPYLRHVRAALCCTMKVDDTVAVFDKVLPYLAGNPSRG